MSTPNTPLARRLAKSIHGEVLFDSYSRGRYSTDASIFQIQPRGVVIPSSEDDLRAAIEIANEFKVPLLARGAGTSQCGQAVGDALIIDFTKYLNKILEFNPDSKTIVVEPGIVLDQLNSFLRPHGLWFPVDVSTAAQATIGGMTGNNSCGARSIRYGNMVHNVNGITAFLADGEKVVFGGHSPPTSSLRERRLIESLTYIGQQTQLDTDPHWPKLLRRVGGYNLDMLPPADRNLSRILVGSEGTLGIFSEIELQLTPIPANRVLGVCHFPSFYAAMATTQHIVSLNPSAVELVDRTMIDLARDIPIFEPAVSRFVRGKPDALLLVEFAGDSKNGQIHLLNQLDELLSSLGFPNAVVTAVDPKFQNEIWEVRKAGLNIMMSMKGDGKPISFIEDCAVALEDLAEYTRRLTDVFRRYNTTGTWYAHASVGCLHVRPILNLKKESDVKNMRAIAEEAFAMVREYKGSHSGEHGDGLIRSEFHEIMFGGRITQLFREVKEAFDKDYFLNPGKIVKPSPMDDRNLFRYFPSYHTHTEDTSMDWSAWGGFSGAVEMCNNNGHCRKTTGVMCPSFQASGEEIHLTRGRANSLRLAISKQIDTDGLASKSLYPTLNSCLSCKGCRRECPTGVDMARMKIEFLRAYHRQHGYQFKHRLIADLPRYANIAHRFRWLAKLRNNVPEIARLFESFTGLSAKRQIPEWHTHPFLQTTVMPTTLKPSKSVAFFVDTFSRWFEPDIVRSAIRVLKFAGYNVYFPGLAAKQRPLCCGRTYLSLGQVDNAKAEMKRTVTALRPYLDLGIPIIGLEPSCILTFQDELGAMLGKTISNELEGKTYLFDEFIATKVAATDLPLASKKSLDILCHSHCHQKAFGKEKYAVDVLSRIPNARVQSITSSCCGMAGAFGYSPDNYDLSMAVGELGVLPAVRESNKETLIVAMGTSCRNQIVHATERHPKHLAEVIDSLVTS